MVIAATNIGSGWIGGGVGLGVDSPRGPGQPPVIPNVLPAPMTRQGAVVKILIGIGATAALIDGWSRIIAEPVPDIDDVARDIREAVEEAQRMLRGGRARYGKTTKPPRRAAPPVKGPQDFYLGPDIFKKIGTDVAERPETKDLPDPETDTNRRTKRKKKERVKAFFERRYSVRLGSRNELMLLPRELEKARRATRRRNNGQNN